jgi:hypothetical protein
MRRLRFFLPLALLLALAPPPCPAQKRAARRAAAGKISGVVLDRNDARIVGAAITISNAGLKRELKSDEEGSFRVELPAGSYQIEARANGFRRFELSPFVVNGGATELINIHMEVAAISDPY